MPYQGEFASHRSLQRLASDERIKSLLQSYEVRASDPTTALSLNWQSASPSDWSPSYVLAVDGSHREVPIENGFPGAEVSYVTVASVILNVEKMKQLDARRPVDPVKFRELEEADSIDCALPGCNVICTGELSPKASLRSKLFEEFLNRQMDSSGETLLDTYESLLALKPAKDQNCPCSDEGCPSPEGAYKRANGSYPCPCPLKRTLYSTDALRIHEDLNAAGTNGALFAEIMQVWERVWIIHLLRAMEKRNLLSSLARVAFVLDGPLAVFGHPAWLSQAIESELKRINKLVKAATGEDLLLIGIEKTGLFATHLEQLDVTSTGAPNAIPSRHFALLDDAYIKRNIQYSISDRPFGRQTYFGRKFFYKTRSSALIVGVLPYLNPDDDDLTRADSTQYPRLLDTLSLLDDLVSVRYPNSLTAIVAAHAEAAIPLHLGGTILEQLARNLIGNPTP